MAKATERPQRADARRNASAILDAAERCLVADPEVSVAAIAAEAGVGRVTLYGHFPTRADLIEAVFARVTARAADVLDEVHLDGEPTAALEALVRASWRIVHQHRSVLAAAERELPPAKVRGHHDAHLERLTRLIERGRAAGAFRTDLPVSWLVTVAYTLMHAAAGEEVAGRLDAAGTEDALVRTIRAAYERAS